MNPSFQDCDPPTVRVICASLSRVAGSPMDEMLALRNRYCCPQRRPRARSAWLHIGGWFVFRVEGTEAAVDETLARAAADARITGQRTLHRSVGPALLQEPIAVASTQVPSLRPAAFAHAIERMRQGGCGTTDLDAIWERISEPCALSAEEPWSQRPLREVAFVAAEDQGPLEAFRRLGEQLDSPVIYRRFGGQRMHSTDVGAAYLDVPVEGGFARVRMLGRRALVHPALRATLSRLDALVLLLGPRASSAIDLSTHLCETFRMLPSPPPVYLADGDAATIQACSRLLQRCDPCGNLADPGVLAGGQLMPWLASLGLQPQPRMPQALAA